MLLYHGTSRKRWEDIKTNGLKTRTDHGKSNWDHSIESNPDTVYLTAAYSLYFALGSVDTSDLDNDGPVLIEIDTDRLDCEELVPDEDALEQVSRKHDDSLPPEWGMVERTRYYRSRVKDFAEAGLTWEWSLQMLGTCGYVGRIPPSAFTRVAMVDMKQASRLCMTMFDASVNVDAYQIRGPEYRNLTRRIFRLDAQIEPELIQHHPFSICHRASLDGVTLIECN